MSVDYTANAVFGFEASPPEDTEDVEEWCENICADTPFSYFTAGNSYSGDVNYFIGIGKCNDNYGWSKVKVPTTKQIAMLNVLTAQLGAPKPSWYVGLHVW